jgi:XTP/dITP diphosphohydrolase
MTIALASGNFHKLKELAAIFGSGFSGEKIDVRFRLPAAFGISEFEPDESGATFADNALIKARALYAMLAEIRAKNPEDKSQKFDAVLADDSGLCVGALGGGPGIFSARYGSADGKKITAEERNALLLDEVEKTISAWGGGADSPGCAAGGRGKDAAVCRALSVESAPPSLRACRFVCAMVLLYSPDRFCLAQETLEGVLVPSMAEARGEGGFGYDPVVYLPAFGRTLAELSEDEKNAVSHRGKAGRAIAALLGKC